MLHLGCLGLLIGLTIFVARSSPANTSFLSYSLAGAFAIHLWSRLCRIELLAVLIAAVVCLISYCKNQGLPTLDLPTRGFFLGLGSLGVLGGRRLIAPRLPLAVFPALLLPTTLVVTVLAQPLWPNHQSVWDWTAFAFDGRLGGLPSLLLGGWFATIPGSRRCIKRSMIPSLSDGLALRSTCTPANPFNDSV
jgi:hypothetical protein